MSAVVTLLGSIFNTSSGTKTVTATPAVGDLIVIVAAHSGNVASVNPTDNNGPGSYTLVQIVTSRSSADGLAIYIRNSLVASAVSTTFTHANGSSSGGGIAVLKVTGVTATGGGAVKRNGGTSNVAGGAALTIAMGGAVLTTNPVIAAALNGTSPATLTPCASPAYAELLDLGYSTPTTGFEVQSINSGETRSTLTWGSTSASIAGLIAVELNAASANVGAASGAGDAIAVGQVTAAGVGASTATGAAAAVGTGNSLAVGASAGQSAAQGVFAAVTASAGSASGAGAGAAISSLNSTIVGSSAGVGSAAAASASIRAGAGASAGTGAAAAGAVALSSASGTAGGVSVTMGNATATSVSIGWLIASNSSERWTKQQPSGVITDHNGDPILDETGHEITDGLTEVWAARNNQATVWTEAA